MCVCVCVCGWAAAAVGALLRELLLAAWLGNKILLEHNKALFNSAWSTGRRQLAGMHNAQVTLMFL